jgi:hypothetical protein
LEKRNAQVLNKHFFLAFNKCKSFIENGQRLENMSWRLWQFNHSRKSTNKIDNSTIKRFITAVLLSPADTVHDAYSHEVPQQIRSAKEERPTEMSRTSSFCMVPVATTVDHVPNESTKVQQSEQLQKQFVVVTDDDDEDEDEDEDDYYLSDEDEEEEEDDDYEQNINFVNDFKKTQPRPTTPRRSLLSDLFGRVSSPPSLLSNSTSSFTSTTSTSITLDDEAHQHSSHIALTKQKPSTSDPSEIRWRESFHGW